MLQVAGVKGDLMIYTTAIAHCSKRGKSEEAIRTSAGMLAAGIKPNSDACNGIVNAYIMINNMGKAISHYEEMVAAGLQPNDVAHNTAIGFYAEAGKVEKAISCFESMVAAGASAHTGCACTICCPQILAVLLLKWPPVAHSSVCVQGFQWTKLTIARSSRRTARRARQHKRSSGSKRWSRPVSRAACKQSDFSLPVPNAQLLCSVGGTPEEDTVYMAAIRAYGVLKMPAEVVRWAAAMEKADLRPDAGTYSLVVRVLCESKQKKTTQVLATPNPVWISIDFDHRVRISRRDLCCVYCVSPRVCSD